MTINSIFCVFSLFFVLNSDPGGASNTYYVSPSGDDGNSGLSPSRPLKTLEEAKSRVRSATAAMTDDIIVMVGEGRYELDAPLVFNEQDGGQNGHRVIWKNKDGELPVISGGVLNESLSFSPWNGTVYLSDQGFDFPYRDLWINGERCTLARLENDNPVTTAGRFIIADNLYLEFDPQYENHIQIPKSAWVELDFSQPETPEIQLLDKWMSHIVHITSAQTNGDYVYLEIPESEAVDMVGRKRCAGTEAHITLDLGSMQTITQTKIAWKYGYNRDSYYRLFASIDGVSWFAIQDNATRTTRTSSLLDIGTGTYSARYLRYVILGTSINQYDYISEIQLFNNGLPVVVQSESFNSGRYANATFNAVTDGDLETWWWWKKTDFERIKGSVWLQNSRSYLDVGGEFIRSERERGRILYVPRAGENMSSVSAIAGKIPTLLRIEGGSQLVKNLVFEGLHFADTAGPDIDNNGYVDMQANDSSENMQTIVNPAAIEMGNAEQVEFYKCSFYRLGGTAMHWSKKVKSSVIEGCGFSDIGGGAISFYTGGQNSAIYLDYANSCDLNKMSNNLFSDIGQQLYGGVTIWALAGRTNTISHNYIKDAGYTGISWGWGWGRRDAAPGEHNHIEYNRIDTAMKTLTDGGAIYTLGNLMDEVYGLDIFENYMLNLHKNPFANTYYPVTALYFDVGSKNAVAENNVSVNVEMKLFENISGSLADNNILDINNNGTDVGVISRSGLAGAYTNLPSTYQLARPVSAEKRNLSLGSIQAASSEYGASTRKERAVDLDMNTIWATGSSDTERYLSLDLLKEYPIDRIEIVGRQDVDQPDSRKNFVIEASNDGVAWTQIASQGSSPYPYQATWSVDLVGSSEWRFARVRKTDGNHFNFAEFKVLMDDY